MSGYSQSSRDAYATVDVAACERIVLDHAKANFAIGEFTRAELNKSLALERKGWEINQTTGRVNALVKKGELIEDKGRTIKCKVGMSAHPLRLKNAAVRVGEDLATTAQRSSAPAAPIGVIPTLFSRDSLSVADAKRIYPSDKANAFYDEAKRVVESGTYRVWL